MDISSLSIQESTVVQLTHPANGELLYVDKNDKLTTEKTDKPVTITVLSTASRAYRRAVTAMQNRTLKRGAKKVTAEMQKEEGVELLVAVCETSDNLEYKGSPVKDEADFRALLSDDKMSWIKTQVDEALGNVELFIA